MLRLERCKDFSEVITLLVLCEMNCFLSFGSIIQLKRILSFSKKARKINNNVRKKLSMYASEQLEIEKQIQCNLEWIRTTVCK
jgi:hypothetical protein